MALDLTKPVTTDNYATGVLPTIRGNDLALARFLEGESITGNQAGVKRYNATSKLFERWNGSAWGEMELAYAKLAGADFTGTVGLGGLANYWAGSVGGNSGINWDANDTLVYDRTNNVLRMYINSAQVFSQSATGFDLFTIAAFPANSYFKASGTEGGELRLQKGSGQPNLVGDVAIDTMGDLVRIFDAGSGSRLLTWNVISGALASHQGLFWNAGNDGAGSGLDADLLDGVQGAAYARRDVANEHTARVRINVGRTSANWSFSLLELYTPAGSAVDFAGLACHVQDASAAPQFGYYHGSPWGNRLGWFNSDASDWLWMINTDGTGAEFKGGATFRSSVSITGNLTVTGSFAPIELGADRVFANQFSYDSNTSFTLGRQHFGRTVKVSKTSGATTTLTLPSETSASVPNGARVRVMYDASSGGGSVAIGKDTGVVLIEGANTDVSLTLAIGNTVEIEKVSANRYRVVFKNF